MSAATRTSIRDVPGNVIVESWFPQPSVIPQVDAVIHHGGNNSFTECLYFGKPAIIMPYVWDGHDNATRVEETGHGFKMPRYDWTDDRAARQDRGLPHRPGDEGEARGDVEAHAGAERAGEGGGPAGKAAVTSSAPHLHEASTRDRPCRLGRPARRDRGRVALDRPARPQGAEQPAGNRHLGLHAGRWRLSIPRDEFCHFVAGRATYRSDDGEVIEVAAGTLVMFPAGWTGECTVHETIRNIYMLAEDEPDTKEPKMPTPIMKSPLDRPTSSTGASSRR